MRSVVAVVSIFLALGSATAPASAKSDSTLVNQFYAKASSDYSKYYGNYFYRTSVLHENNNNHDVEIDYGRYTFINELASFPPNNSSSLTDIRDSLQATCNYYYQNAAHINALIYQGYAAECSSLRSAVSH